MKNLLVTGGAGFIGSNFIPYLLSKYNDYHIVNLDALTYAGDLSNLKEVESHKNYTFIHGNICDNQLVKELFDKYDFNGVLHFAAESHVDNSIEGPEAFIRTNVFGTFTLLDAARKHWMEAPFSFRKGKENNRFLHVSTDEVYGSLGPVGLFTESTPYAPNSPYSASKASSDMLVRSYFHTYGLNVVTTNCSNNYGPKQHSEKLIPTIIRKAISGQPIPIYGDGKNVRDWLYVLDHATGIDRAFQDGKSGETYNIGGRNERTNNQIAATICSLLDSERPRSDGKSYSEQISFVKDRAGHDRRYAIDATRIENELGWSAAENFETGIRKTIKWYLQEKFGGVAQAGQPSVKSGK
ncbi:MAG TPA: dTDP-glucose 4,6-dehydratase [Chryseolinea sp.]